jgi:DNA repair exonuclease SbcCD ATPase subunit
MKLISAAVRNYRVHRDTRVTFAPGLNLITGPNESGKSTLVEAIHRTLFLRARGTTAAHERMRSTTSPGTPEVIVAFEQKGKTCTLTKQFTKGTILEVAGEPARRDAEAEELLAKLLCSGETIQGGGVDSKLELRWAHLWAWQGKSGSAPGETAREQNAELVRCLQELGGGAVVSSALDSRLLARFRTAVDEAFVRTRGYRAGSAVAAAQEAMLQAKGVLDQAAATLATIEGYVTVYQQAETFLREATPQVEQLDSELRQVQSRREQARVLNEQRQEAERCWQREADESERLHGAVASIASARKKLVRLTQSIAEKDSEADNRQRAAQDARAEANRLRAAVEPARKALAQAQALSDAGAAQAELLEKQRNLAELATALRRVADLEAEARRFDDELARVPRISKKDVNGLHRLRDADTTAAAALQAMSAQVELLRAGVPVSVGGIEVASGSTTTITDRIEVKVGDLAVFRLTPGGGQTLAEARRNAAQAQAALRTALQNSGMESLEAAEAALAQVDGITGNRAATVRALEALEPERLRERHTEAARNVEGARARLELCARDIPEFTRAADLEAARAALQIAHSALAEARRTAAAAERELTTSDAIATELEQAARTAQDGMAAARSDLGRAQGELEGLIGAYGDDDALQAKVTDSAARLDAAQKGIADFDRQLAALQPDRLQADAARLERSLGGIRCQIGENQTSQSVALSHLQSAGTSDPRGDVSLARQLYERATARSRELVDQAAASRRLADLFAEEQARAMATIIGWIRRPPPG